MMLFLLLVGCGPSLSLLNDGDSVLSRIGVGGSMHATTADGLAVGDDGTLWAMTFQNSFVLKLDGAIAVVEVALNSQEAPIVRPDGSIVVRADDDVVAVDSQGAELWRTPAPGNILSRLAQRSDGSLVAAGTIVEGGNNIGYTVFSVGPDGGETGRAGLTEQPRTAIAVGPDDTTYVGASDVHAFDADLNEVWSTTLAATLDSIAVDGERVYAHTVTNSLVALDAATGDTLWTAVGVGSDPVLASNDRIYVTGSKESEAGVWLLDARDGEVLNQQTRACFGGAVGRDDNLYTSCKFPEIYTEGAYPNGIPFVPTVMSPDGEFLVPEFKPEHGHANVSTEPVQDNVVLLDNEAWFIGGPAILHYATRTGPADTAWSHQRGSSDRSGRAR